MFKRLLGRRVMVATAALGAACAVTATAFAAVSGNTPLGSKTVGLQPDGST